MSCTIHSFGIVGNVPSYKAALGRADLQVKYPSLSPQFPPREFVFGEFCISLSGLRWASVWTSHGTTLHYSSQHKIETLCCGLWSPGKKKKVTWGKGRLWRKERRKRFHSFLLSCPFYSLIKALWALIDFFSPCFNIIKNLDSLSLRFHISILKILPFFS